MLDCNEVIHVQTALASCAIMRGARIEIQNFMYICILCAFSFRIRVKTNNFLYLFSSEILCCLRFVDTWAGKNSGRRLSLSHSSSNSNAMPMNNNKSV